MSRRDEIIVVRSLAESDLGIFSAHRLSATSKQRAIALTTPVARKLLSVRLFESGGADMDLICVYGGYGNRELRSIGKVGKNWRLGGHKITANACAFLDSKDFVLLRSVPDNDGDQPILMTFIGRQRERLLHAGIVASLAAEFRDSVAMVSAGSDAFYALSAAFPAVPADLAVSPPLAEDDAVTREQAAGNDGR
ncbi:hypothetical protein [Pinisolibacter aquiterrae]|uniref:hypothetical protein n=1 Tax=Pinisolibacter aquiterrae TaxID=2815579 RepID=UPI001C3E2231|nr:hypothetical protein [Pinisolibacter aquiterrae]MBV5265028.1 hypothetical protein [Pinisolibacter aquiterrae]MCC8235590.1 hypothetical protein [Pinisolibacter aquiterrae]